MGFFDSLKKAAGDVATGAVNALGNQKKEFVFEAIPTTLDELKARPEANLQDPFGVAALTAVALNLYPVNADLCLAMLNFLKGPESLSPMDASFIKDRFMDGDYVPRSYFKGATPANSYEPSTPYTVEVTQTSHSKDMGADYFTLYLQSGGADSPRPVSFRKKASTGEWFLWSDSYKGLLAGIRIPAAANPWA